MAALPYMQFYVADYLADTMHLSTEEHGAYLLIIFNYWQIGKPIPKARLPKIARLNNERWASVEQALSEFFKDDGEQWIHERIECDLASVKVTQDQRIAAGKASAEARKQAKKAEISMAINGRSTDAQHPLNEIEEIRGEENNLKAIVASPATANIDLFQAELEAIEDDSVPAGKKKLPFTYKDLQNLYNRICRGTFDGCDAMNKKRKANVRAMVEMEFMGEKPFRDHGLEFWEIYFNDCLKDPHWCGKNDRGWRADFEFVTRPDKALKVLERG